MQFTELNKTVDFILGLPKFVLDFVVKYGFRFLVKVPRFVWVLLSLFLLVICLTIIYYAWQNRDKWMRIYRY